MDAETQGTKQACTLDVTPAQFIHNKEQFVSHAKSIVLYDLGILVQIQRHHKHELETGKLNTELVTDPGLNPRALRQHHYMLHQHLFSKYVDTGPCSANI